MDDLSGRINEFLSNPESMEKIKSLIGMLSENADDDKRKNESSPDDGSLPFDTATLVKMQKALSLLKKDDPRVTLLLALKPNLSQTRQKKVDEAIHLMRLINLIPLLQEGNFL